MQLYAQLRPRLRQQSESSTSSASSVTDLDLDLDLDFRQIRCLQRLRFAPLWRSALLYGPSRYLGKVTITRNAEDPMEA